MSSGGGPHTVNPEPVSDPSRSQIGVAHSGKAELEKAPPKQSLTVAARSDLGFCPTVRLKRQVALSSACDFIEGVCDQSGEVG